MREAGGNLIMFVLYYHVWYICGSFNGRGFRTYHLTDLYVCMHSFSCIFLFCSLIFHGEQRLFQPCSIIGYHNQFWYLLIFSLFFRLEMNLKLDSDKNALPAKKKLTETCFTLDGTADVSSITPDFSICNEGNFHSVGAISNHLPKD